MTGHEVELLLASIGFLSIGGILGLWLGLNVKNTPEVDAEIERLRIIHEAQSKCCRQGRWISKGH